MAKPRIEGEDTWRPGAMSLGVRPTFDGQVRTLEVHLVDWNGDLYGRDLELRVVERLRDEVRFDSVQALIDQMGRDVQRCREILAASAADGASRSAGMR